MCTIFIPILFKMNNAVNFCYLASILSDNSTYNNEDF